MPRERREFRRPAGFRGVLPLVVIACEGAETEPKYFRGYKGKMRLPVVHVEVLDRPDPSDSSPAAVLSMLDAFRNEYRVREGDRLWLVIDRDKWTNKMLSEVAQQTVQRGYLLAVSNPCFEIWLLLHFEDVAASSLKRKDDLFENKNQLLKSAIGMKMQPNLEYIENFFLQTNTAIQRAKNLDPNPKARWPNGLGTRVHRLVEGLSNR